MNQAVLPHDIWDEKDLENILGKELGDFSRWYCQEMAKTYDQLQQAREARLPKEKVREYDRRIDGLFVLHHRYFRGPAESSSAGWL